MRKKNDSWYNVEQYFHYIDWHSFNYALGEPFLKVLEGDEKKEYEQFWKFHVDMRKITEPDYKTSMACKAPKGFDKA